MINLPTVLIAAHNEETVLGRCLDSLNCGTDSELDVIVIANGCIDHTADVARAYDGVNVVELEPGGKSLALNVGEREARFFPRIYLDADIVVPEGGVSALVAALQTRTALAAVPARSLEVADRPWLVRAYSTISVRHPAFQDGLFGRGMIAISEAGRARFGEFPLMVADDLFLDSLFDSSEKTHVDSFSVTVSAPFTTRELLGRLIRVRRGNAAMRRAAMEGKLVTEIRRANRLAWLRDVVLPEPRLLPAGIAYVVLSILAALLAKRGPLGDLAWGRSGHAQRQSR